MRSQIYHGRVWHMRNGPRYFFSYGAFYLDLHLQEVDDVARRLWAFSHNRLNLLSLYDRDYLALTRSTSTDEPLGRASLLTQPRLLNYAFNPVSFLLRRDAEGQVGHVVAEVHNTWGERHLYDLARAEDTPSYTSGTNKGFYVSPFIDMQGRYEFRLADKEGRLRLRIDEYREGDAAAFFRAGMDLQPLPLTNANVIRMLARYPLVTFKTIAAIHWQGLKLWRRGEPFRPNPRRSRTEVEAL